MPLEQPPLPRESIQCSISAAVEYQVPANLMLAIVQKEGGKPGLISRNKNGTADLGPMQFNTAYLQDLAKYGITQKDVLGSGCYPFHLAAWRIRGHLQNDKGDIWTRAANWHSRTPSKNAAYRNDMLKKAEKWGQWLATHYQTHVYRDAYATR